jgi:hypothetical protein
MASCSFTPAEIQAFTDVSHRQQQRILKLWNETATVKKKEIGPGQGRPRHLTLEDVAVSISN